MACFPPAFLFSITVWGRPGNEVAWRIILPVHNGITKHSLWGVGG